MGTVNKDAVRRHLRTTWYTNLYAIVCGTRGKHVPKVLLYSIAVIFVLFVVATTSTRRSTVVDTSVTAASASNHLTPLVNAESYQLASEPIFQSTLFSCLPQNKFDPRNHPKSKKCMEFVPANSSQRIVIMVPPGHLGEIFANWIATEVAGSPNRKQFEMLVSSHVPPYGYGKTHGWTKILRLVTDPLIWQVYDTAGAACVHSGTTTTTTTITEEEMKSTLSQIVRWHCRLSHIAAHTATLSVKLSHLLQQPESTITEIMAFISGDPSVRARPGLKSDLLQQQVDKLQLNIGLGTDVLHSTLQKELDTSDNLSKWPCQSFWMLEDETETSRCIAKALSPNCTMPYTSCVVKRDKCEERGDAKCA